MLKNLKQRKNAGFTIVEVMIVLAIAGLILLIVFLAVPALQRNAHNTSIKNDVAGILSAMNEYTDNNNGNLATTAAINGNTAYIGGNFQSCQTAGANCATAKVGYETSLPNPTSTIDTSTPPIGKVVLFTTAVCNGNTPTSNNATGRDFVAYYQLVGGAVQCEAS